MAKENNVRGVEKLELGIPGDGVVGASLTSFTEISLDSVTVTGGKGSNEDISTYQEDVYLSVTTTTEARILEVTLYGVTGENLVLLMGGSWDATGKEWSAPANAPNIYLSAVLTSEETNGKKAVLTYAYAKIDASFDGSIGKSQLLDVKVTITANTPISAAGVKGSPFKIKYIDA